MCVMSDSFIVSKRGISQWMWWQLPRDLFVLWRLCSWYISHRVWDYFARKLHRVPDWHVRGNARRVLKPGPEFLAEKWGRVASARGGREIDQICDEPKST